MNKSEAEAEVFGDVESCPVWTKYVSFKVYCKSINVKPTPPDVWLYGQVLMLIDKGEVTDVERAVAEDALGAVGWQCNRNTKGQLVLRPGSKWCEEHEQPMWKDGLKCGGCLENN